MFDKPILNHAEVRELTQGGVMHEGLVSLVLGLPGMPAVAEDVMTGRDIALADATGGRIHIMHVSSAGSVDLIRRAKGRGVRVTTEVCPHHFTLTDECLRTFDSNYKMSPPLRGRKHVDACIAGLVRRHDRRDLHRPRPARAGKEDARAGPGPVRHRGAGNRAGTGRHAPDRAGPSRLAHGAWPK